jgi:hypothetical protein
MVSKIWQTVFDASPSSKTGMVAAGQPAVVGTQHRLGLKASRVSTMDVREEEGLTLVGGCNPAHVHEDTGLPLKVMSNELAIDDGHPLALELQSLRATIAKYQVFVALLSPGPIPDALRSRFRSTRRHLHP